MAATKYWWQCTVDSTHEWQAGTAQMRGGKSCPICFELTREKIEAAGKVFFARTGNWPTKRSEDATSDFGRPETWRAVDESLRLGLRGLSGGSSVAQVFVSKTDTDDDLIVSAVQEFVAEKGKPPGSKDKLPVFTTPRCPEGSTLSAISRRRMKQGLGSVHDLLRDRGLALLVTHEEYVTEVAISSVESAILSFRRETGRWPSQLSGDATAYFGFCWSWVMCSKYLANRGNTLTKVKTALLFRHPELEVAKPPKRQPIRKFGLPPPDRVPLTEETVLKARDLYRSKSMTLQEIADFFQSEICVIRAAVRGVNFRYLPGAVTTEERKGQRERVGAKNNKSKLLWEQVVEARALYSRGEGSSVSLAKKYGIATSSMYAILMEQTRKTA